MPAGDRYHTAWLKMLGSGVPKPPLVRMQLISRGPDLVGIHAQVTLLQQLAYHVAEQRPCTAATGTIHWIRAQPLSLRGPLASVTEAPVADSHKRHQAA